MLKIRTYLDKSDIHGIGVFADENVVKDQIIWKFDERFDKVLQYEDIMDVSNDITCVNESNFIYKHGYYDKQLNRIILSSDNDKFTNHSDNPNTIALENGLVVAARDIGKGEELTIDYFGIDEFAHEKLTNI